MEDMAATYQHQHQVQPPRPRPGPRRRRRPFPANIPPRRRHITRPIWIAFPCLPPLLPLPINFTPRMPLMTPCLVTPLLWLPPPIPLHFHTAIAVLPATQSRHQGHRFPVASSPRPPSQRQTVLDVSPSAPASSSGERLTPPSQSAPNLNQEVQSDPRKPPYPWATSRRAQVQTLEYLRSNGIKKISSMVDCYECFKGYEMEYDLEERFLNLANFIAVTKDFMDGRAPEVWRETRLVTCKFCHITNCVMPTTKRRSINWLFLLLGQTLACCAEHELRYFCKHNGINCRGANKDRLLYLVYMALCKQLDPDGPFDP